MLGWRDPLQLTHRCHGLWDVRSIRSASDRLETQRVDALVDCSYRRVLGRLDSSGFPRCLRAQAAAARDGIRLPKAAKALHGIGMSPFSPGIGMSPFSPYASRLIR
jgi:hypothetical protein